MWRNRIRLTGVLLLLLLAAEVEGAADVPARLSAGAELFEAAEYSSAQQFFSSVPPGSDTAWVAYFLGRIHLEQNEVDFAIERLLEAVEADPKSSSFQRWLGHAYVEKIDQVGMLKKMGLAKKARASFEQAVELSPGDFEAREAMADYYLNAPSIAGGSRAKAEEQVAAMKKLDPGKGHRLMGRIYVEDEEWQEAAREFHAAIEAGDRGAEAYYLLGFSLQQDEDFPGAFEAFEKAIAADPGDLSSYYQIGRTAIFAEQNLERAVECLKFYLEQPHQRSSPALEHAHWRLGMVYELQDKNDLAAAEYRKALELDPQHEEARKALKALGSA